MEHSASRGPYPSGKRARKDSEKRVSSGDSSYFAEGLARGGSRSSCKKGLYERDAVDDHDLKGGFYPF